MITIVTVADGREYYRLWKHNVFFHCRTCSNNGWSTTRLMSSYVACRIPPFHVVVYEISFRQQNDVVLLAWTRDDGLYVSTDVLKTRVITSVIFFSRPTVVVKTHRWRPKTNFKSLKIRNSFIPGCRDDQD